MSGMERIELTDKVLIEQYFKLDEQLEAINEASKKAGEPLRQGMTAIKGMLQQRLNERGAKHTSVEGGTAYRVNNMSVKCTDKQAYIEFCFANPEWGSTLLTANVAKDALAKFLEAHTVETPDGPIEQSPPGVEVDYVETLRIVKT